MSAETPAIEGSTFRKRARKALILTALLLLLGPLIMVNIGVNAQNAGWPEPLRQLDRPFPVLDALILCQRWYLFTSIPPFNYTLHYEVELVDGRTVLLHDFEKENAGKWQSILFHNEPKTENNLYSNPTELRQYTEYLVWRNGINPSEIARRIIFLQYRNVLPRAQAAVAGTYYGPESQYVIDSY